MVKRYIEALFKDQQEIFQEESIDFYSGLTTEYTDLEMMSGIYDGEYPLIVYSMENSYICDDSITEYTILNDGHKETRKIDYKEGLLIKPTFYINIVSDNPEHNADIEDLLLAAYATGRDIIIDYELNDKICMSVKRKNHTRIVRKKMNGCGKNVLTSTICLEAINPGFVLCEKPHPAKVAFDHFLQIELLEKLVSYNDLCDYYYNKLPFQILEKTDGFIPTEEDINNEKLYKKIKETSDELLKTTELLDDEHSDPFYIKKIYEIMHENKYTKLEDAIKYFDQNKNSYSDQLDRINKDLEKVRKEKREKEKERLVLERYQKYIDENKSHIMDSVGDPELNRYIDSVIKQIKDIVGEDIDIFGGTSYMNYYKKREKKEVSFPCILIQSKGDFVTDFNYNKLNYKIYTSNGIVNEYKYDYLYYLPYNFKISLHVLYDENSQLMASKIKNDIATSYQCEKQLCVGVPNDSNSFLCLNLKIDKFGESYIGYPAYKIEFYEQLCVYFAFDKKNNDISYDSMYQLSLLKKALFYKKISYRLEAAINSVSSEYKRCFNGNKPNDKERKKDKKYLELKAIYNNKQYIPKDLFDEGFSKIVQIYPDLYNDFNYGLNVEVITEKLKSNMEKIDIMFKNTCDDLSIPDKSIGSFKEKNYRDLSRIRDYIKILSQDEFTIINNLFFDNYESLIINKEKKMRKSIDESVTAIMNLSAGPHKEKVRQDYPSGYTQDYYSDYQGRESSSGLGFFGTTAAIVAGNAISDHFRKSRDSKNEKKDLLGSNQCVLGKKDEYGFTRYGCGFCPVRGQCTRG